MAKLKVMSARSTSEAVETLVDVFSEQHGHDFDVSFGTVGALQKRLDAGEIPDVLISSIPAMDTLQKAGAIVPGTRCNVATTRVGIAVREGAPAPDVSTPEAFRRALVAARSIAFSDAAVGGSAGVYLANLFVDMGLADDIKRKGMPQQSGGEVARRVAEGAADIGMTLIAEIVPIEGVRVLGPLPPPLGNATTYCAAVMTASHEQVAGRQFIDVLTADAARGTWKDAGFELGE